MYGQVLRGTQLARNYELVKLVLPNMYVIGSMTHVDWAQNSNRDTDITFSFQFLVKELVPIAIRMPGVPTSSLASLIDFGSVPGFQTQTQINTVKTSMSELQQLVQDPTSTSGQIASSITGVGSGLSAGIANLSQFGNGSAVNNTFGFTTDGSGSNSSQTGLFNFTSDGSGSSVSSVFTSISANLTGLRASLFSPIYGVLSSLTKLVSAGAGAVNSIFNALTSPVRDIIRAVQDVTSQAVGIVNLVNGTIQGLTGQVISIDNQTRIALGDLTNAAGVITSAPKTIFQSVGDLVNAGTLPISVGYLQNGTLASLSSGNSSGGGGASLGGNGNGISKIALLNSGSKYSAQTAASL
jgi:hypothetical protein